MLNRLREIFLTQYIGAIVVALLLVDVIANVMGLILRPVYYLAWQRYQVDRDFLGGAPKVQRFDWGGLGYVAVEFVLLLMVTYWLIVWLYWPSETQQTDEQSSEPVEG